MTHRFSTVLIGGIAVIAFTQFALAADLPRKGTCGTRHRPHRFIAGPASMSAAILAMDGAAIRSSLRLI